MAKNALSKLIGCGIAFLGITSLCYSLVMTQNTGNWPDSWPKELEQLRNQTRTIEVAAGNQEDIYEISFSNRTQFETLWPVILKVKTPEAPLRLFRISPEEPNALFSNAHPVVRIYAPPKHSSVGPGGKEGEAIAKLQEAIRDASPDKQKKLEEEVAQKWQELVKQGKVLKPGPPWPQDILSATGVLPEYVGVIEDNEKLKWVSSTDKRVSGFLYRARIEVELVVDGDVIDLNRIPLPVDTLILDKRFVK
jgi:hypothetical protein